MVGRVRRDARSRSLTGFVCSIVIRKRSLVSVPIRGGLARCLDQAADGLDGQLSFSSAAFRGEGRLRSEAISLPTGRWREVDSNLYGAFPVK